MSEFNKQNAIELALKKLDKWSVNWTDDDMLSDLSIIIDDLERSYDDLMEEIAATMDLIDETASDPKCVLHGMLR